MFVPNSMTNLSGDPIVLNDPALLRMKSKFVETSGGQTDILQHGNCIVVEESNCC